MADRLSNNGDTIQSALDHVYISHTLESKTTTSKLAESSTDHVPIMVKLVSKLRTPKHAKQTIQRRSMKKFNQEKWNEILATKIWDELDNIDDIHKKAEKFSEMVNMALNEIAPYKSVLD